MDPALMNLIYLFGQRTELNPYEEALYNQLCITMRRAARLTELALEVSIRNVQNGGSLEATRGDTQPDPPATEHGDPDSPTAV